MSDDVRIRCAATTKSGSQCKNYALDGQSYCHVHQSMAAGKAGDSGETNGSQEEIQRLVGELDELIAELKASIPATTGSAYTPLRLINMLRENVSKLPPDLSLGILENFEGMTVDDLKDVDTWKGMAYMLSYSAKFQAGQARERMNESLPDPFKPDTVINFVKKNVDRFAPGIAKDLLANFEGATKEDFLDPDTWKGVWYMLDYSIKFQLEQMKEKLSGEGSGDS
ncbi:MAG: hypothetical protein ACE5FD_04920 [Anaerolineae bacterium]